MTDHKHRSRREAQSPTSGVVAPDRDPPRRGTRRDTRAGLDQRSGRGPAGTTAESDQPRHDVPDTGQEVVETAGARDAEDQAPAQETHTIASYDGTRGLTYDVEPFAPAKMWPLAPPPDPVRLSKMDARIYDQMIAEGWQR